mgnify:CR=1 FL=1
MANIIQLKRGTGASSSATEPAIGEPVFDTGTGKLYISTDGSTALSAMTAINAGTASSLAADNLTALLLMLKQVTQTLSLKEQIVVQILQL